jgi:hypothetical protein
MKRFLATFFVAVLSLNIVHPIASSADAKSTLPLTTPGTFSFGICSSATETECIVSVGVVQANGTYLSAKHIEDFTYPESVVGANVVINGRSMWLINNGKEEQKVGINAVIETPAHFIYGSKTGAALRVFIENADKILVKLRIVVRTSWLKPQNVQLVANQADFSQKKLAIGDEWTFEGSNIQYSDYSNWQTAEKTNYMAKADIEVTSLHFIIHHVGADINSSYFPVECADKGYTVQSWNAPSAGTPFWDKASDSLNFGVLAPHLKVNGEQNTGFFTLWAPEEFITCRWPENTLIGAAKIKVEVLNPDGTQQIAVTSVRQANKTLYFSASGFHYSAPTIRVSAVKAPVVVKKTITCVKGSASKKVTAVNAKCPSGWKKK